MVVLLYLLIANKVFSFVLLILKVVWSSCRVNYRSFLDVVMEVPRLALLEICFGTSRVQVIVGSIVFSARRDVFFYYC